MCVDGYVCECVIARGSPFLYCVRGCQPQRKPLLCLPPTHPPTVETCVLETQVNTHVHIYTSVQTQQAITKATCQPFWWHLCTSGNHIDSIREQLIYSVITILLHTYLFTFCFERHLYDRIHLGLTRNRVRLSYEKPLTYRNQFKAISQSQKWKSVLLHWQVWFGLFVQIVNLFGKCKNLSDGPPSRVRHFPEFLLKDKPAGLSCILFCYWVSPFEQRVLSQKFK